MRALMGLLSSDGRAIAEIARDSRELVSEARFVVCVGLALVTVAGVVSAIAPGPALVWPLVVDAVIVGGTTLVLPFVQLRLYAALPVRFAGVGLFALTLARPLVSEATWRLVQTTSAATVILGGAVLAAASAVLVATRRPAG